MNQEIEDFINSCPPEQQERLRKFQWKLEQDLNRYKDPVARFNRMVEIFWEQVNTFYQALENPSSFLKDGSHKVDNVVKFKQPSSNDDSQ